MKQARSTDAKSYRLAGACFFVGAVCMAIVGLSEERVALLVSAACQFTAWLCFVGYANRLEPQGESESA